MKNRFFSAALVGVVAVLASGSALADSTTDIGMREYNSNCASCHGLGGQGDGPLKTFLTVTPADLTTMAQKNNGVLPLVRLNAVIDGRMAVNSHGSRDMPVWGQDYAAKAGKDWPVPMDVAFSPEFFVRSRIMALIDYIARLQR